MVDVTQIDSTLVVDLPYTTANNFTGVPVYPSHAKAYLRRPVAEALAVANRALAEHGFRLKVWDAYRPFSLQEKFWEIFPDRRYVMQPVRDGEFLIQGSVHSRGAAVDVTMIDGEGNEVLMPTGFDDFSERAHADFAGADAQALRHRELLHTVMHAHGFRCAPTEWWHFNFHDAEQFPLSDTPIDAIEE